MQVGEPLADFEIPSDAGRQERMVAHDPANRPQEVALQGGRTTKHTWQHS